MSAADEASQIADGFLLRALAAVGHADTMTPAHMVLVASHVEAAAQIYQALIIRDIAVSEQATGRGR